MSEVPRRPVLKVTGRGSHHPLHLLRVEEMEADGGEEEKETVRDEEELRRI